VALVLPSDGKCGIVDKNGGRCFICRDDVLKVGQMITIFGSLEERCDFTPRRPLRKTMSLAAFMVARGLIVNFKKFLLENVFRRTRIPVKFPNCN
jgi:hypothetical protein